MKILIKRTAALGDVLLATSVLPVIKDRYPSSQIYFQTDCPEIVETNNLVNFVIQYSDNTSFDLVYDFDLSYEMNPKESIFKSYADIINCNENELSLSFSLSPQVLQKRDEILARYKIPKDFIVIQSSANFWSRNIHNSIFSSIIAKFQDKYSISFVHLGSINDSPVNGAMDLRGIGSIAISAAIIEKSKALIGLDSTLLHFAKALSKPVAIFFGPTDPALRIRHDPHDLVFTPDIECKFCHHRQKPPAFITVCTKNFLFFIFDSLWQTLIRSNYFKQSSIKTFLIKIIKKTVNWREKGRAIPKCLKKFTLADIESQLDTWFSSIVKNSQS